MMNLGKSFICLLAFTTVVYGFLYNDDDIKECREKTNANEDDVKDIMRHRMTKTKEGHCMMGCMLIKKKLMNEENKMDMNGFRKELAPLVFLDSEKHKHIIQACEECIDETGKDECETAEKMMMCLIPKLQQIMDD